MGNTHNRMACQLQPKNAGTGLQKATLVDRTGNLPKSYSVFVIKMTSKAHSCAYTPIPPPLHQNTHGTLNTHMHSHTDASDHYGLLFRQTSDSAFLPLADNRVRGDFFFFFFLLHYFGKGSDKLHSGVLKCQLKMKINNLGVEKVWQYCCNINPTPGQTWYGPGAQWRLAGGQAGSHSRGGVSLFERQEL